MFKRVSDSLQAKFTRKDNLSRQLEIVKIFDVYKKELKKFSPNDKETAPLSLRNKTLTVKTGSAVQANELRFREAEMINKINQVMVSEIIKRITYRF